MTAFMLAPLSAAPFTQWAETDAGTLVYLLPWIVVIIVLIPRRREAESPGVPWLALLAAAAAAAVCAFVGLVAYYLVTGG
jgi:hypothetical protein